jgi:hypothetical protein
MGFGGTERSYEVFLNATWFVPAVCEMDARLNDVRMMIRMDFFILIPLWMQIR